MSAEAVAALVAGIFSAMGMGGVGIMIIYFSLFTSTSQILAQGINVLIFIPIALLSVIIYHIKGMIEWKIAIPFALFGTLSSYLGAYLATVTDDALLSKGFGILLLIMGIRQLFSSKDKKLPKKDSGQKFI